MKSNDVAGIGNFNTAEFWEYNTRTGRRLNLDPKGNVSRSGYATFSGNPVWLMDIKGDTPSYTPPAMINPDPAERFFTWLLTDATPALKPVQALENYGQRNWYVERDSHYGPLGFKYNGWPMWKAIWGVGGTVVSGGGLYIAPSFEGILGLTLGGYNAMNDVYEAKTGNKLPISEQTGRADAIINSTELGKDLVKIVKSARGAPNPMNILGITTFILDKTLFKDNLDNGEKSRDSSPTQQTKQTKKKVNWGMSPYAL